MSSPSGIIEEPLYLIIRENPGDEFLKIVAVASGLEDAQNEILRREQLDKSHNGAYKGVPVTSGVQEIGVTNIITNNITGIASGVANLLRFDLPLNADDDDINHTFVNNLPVAEYDDNQRSSWNLKTPVGGISGIEFDFSWFPEKNNTNKIYSFDLEIRELPVDTNTSTVTPITATISKNTSISKDILTNSDAKINVDIPGLQDISISLTRKSSSWNGKARVVSYGIIYKSEETA